MTMLLLLAGCSLAVDGILDQKPVPDAVADGSSDAGPLCLAASEPCTDWRQCCTTMCVPASYLVDGGVPDAGLVCYCRPAGLACTIGFQCCSGTCEAEVCR